MTAKKNVAGVTTELFGLLEPLSPEDRQRAISAALTLLGTPTTLPASPIGTGVAPAPAVAGNAQAFFAQKQPQSTPEALAVAARYRELTQSAMEHAKDDLKSVFRDARRSFDARNFGRDIGNARTVGFFVRGKEISLADYGQQYVDKLPDRTATKDLKRPKRGKKKKKRGSG